MMCILQRRMNQQPLCCSLRDLVIFPIEVLGNIFQRAGLKANFIILRRITEPMRYKFSIRKMKQNQRLKLLITLVTTFSKARKQSADAFVNHKNSWSQGHLG